MLMRYFFATVLFALVSLRVVAVDFKTYYLQRTDEPQAEFKLLLHLYQTHLNTTLAHAYYHRYLLNSLLALPPTALPAMLQLPVPVNLPHDDWAQQPRLDLLAVAEQRLTQMHPVLARVFATRIRYRGKDCPLREHLATLSAKNNDRHSMHLFAQAILQALQADSQQLQQLQALAQRLPTARQLSVRQQRQASATLRSLLLAVRWQEVSLSNAERGLLEQLVRDQQRQRRWLHLVVGGGTLTAAVLLGHGVRRLHRVDWRKLWSQRVLGMHLGYSLTTLVSLYPAWQLGRAGKRHLQRYLQTPPDMREYSDYRIAYLAFITNPHNLQRQQQTLLTLNRCVQTLLKPLFAADDIVIKVNPHSPRYRSDHNNNRLTIYVPYSVSHTSQFTSILIKIISHYRQEPMPTFALPSDLTRYCH